MSFSHDCHVESNDTVCKMEICSSSVYTKQVKLYAFLESSAQTGLACSLYLEILTQHVHYNETLIYAVHLDSKPAAVQFC